MLARWCSTFWSEKLDFSGAIEGETGVPIPTLLAPVSFSILDPSRIREGRFSHDRAT